MADGEEEAIDSDIDKLLVGLATTTDEMGALDTVVTEETEGVVLEEDLDILAVADALLHHLRGTQEGLADDEIDLLADATEIEGILAGGVATTDDGNDLLTVEEAIAGGTGRDTLTHVLGLVGESEVLGGGSGGDDNGVGEDLLAGIIPGTIGTGGEIDTDNLAIADIGAETLGLTAQVEHHLVAIDSVGVAREILDLGGLGELSARLESAVLDRLEVGTGGIDGSGVAGRATADNQTLCIHLCCFKGELSAFGLRELTGFQPVELADFVGGI